MLQEDKVEWLIFPDGAYCWWPKGYPALDGKCCWCGRSTEEHKTGRIILG